MKGEKLYELLDHLDDNLVLESAEIKRATWRRRLAVLLSVIAVIFVVWLVTTDAARNPRQDVGGQTGALQDGVYYVYAGSGMPLPTESRVPQGLVRYTPGQGKQLLVAYDDHPMDPLLPAWGVNRHGLYFVDTGDPAAPKLFRKDLATGEETLLFTAHPRPTDRRDVHRQQSFRELFLEGGLLEDLYDPALFLDQVGEDSLTLTYRYPDGATSDTLVLDSRTGEELSRTRDPEDRWRAYAGDRAIDVIPRTQDPEAVPRLVDLQENGTSLLPPGAVAEAPAQAFWGGLLAWYTGQGTEGCLLLTPDGGTYDLPAGPEEEGRTYLAAARGWVYYLATVSREREHGAVLPLQVLQARNLATGEEVPVAEGVLCTAMVTDGAWCFLTNGATTDCYSLTTDDQGRPCGLTLVEQTI